MSKTLDHTPTGERLVAHLVEYILITWSTMSTATCFGYKIEQNLVSSFLHPKQKEMHAWLIEGI